MHPENRRLLVVLGVTFGTLVAVGLLGAFVAYLMHWMWWQQ